MGDHSIDHLLHNGIRTPANAYQNVERDFSDFGPTNVRVVLGAIAPELNPEEVKV